MKKSQAIDISLKVTGGWCVFYIFL